MSRSEAVLKSQSHAEKEWFIMQSHQEAIEITYIDIVKNTM
jgi:hypothetical protein